MTETRSGPKMTQLLSFPRPLTTVDIVIFGVINECLCVLLVRRPNIEGEPFPGMWALPGGFVDVERDDSLQGCAQRKLMEKTGVSSPYLEQLGSWGSATRDPRGWSATHVYFALIPAQNVRIEKGGNAADVRWLAIDEARACAALAFDHAEIMQAAIARLRNKVEYTSLPAYLLPDEFTLSELQHVYEIVLGRRIEKSAFRTRILTSELVEPSNAIREGSNRPAQLYRLKDRGELVFFPRTFKPRVDERG